MTKDAFGADACEDCALGYYSEMPSRKRKCARCPVGKWQPRMGQPSCRPREPVTCPTGKFMSHTYDNLKQLAGAVDIGGIEYYCMSCPLGKFQERIGSESCARCPLGRFTDGYGFAICTPCGAGRYMTALQYAQHGTAAIKGYVPEFAADILSGKSKLHAVDLCTDCAPGQFSARGKGRCMPCPAGKFASTNGAKACAAITCPRHEVGVRGAKAEDGEGNCAPCSAGRFTLPHAPNKCRAYCPTGTISKNGNGVAPCLNCPAGHYASEVGQEQCHASQCARGRFAAERAASAADCSKCPRTQWSDGGFAVCHWLCQPGEFSATGRGEGSARCPGCPLGKFSSTASATSCELTRCPLGLVPRAAARSAEGDCMSCPEGKWALLAHPNVCRVYCSAGRYQGVRDAPGTNCKACPAGKFQPRWGQFHCDATTCPVGTENRDAGSKSAWASCKACALGRWSFGGTTRCAKPPSQLAVERSCSHTFCTQHAQLLGRSAHPMRPIHVLHHRLEKRGTQHRCSFNHRAEECQCTCWYPRACPACCGKPGCRDVMCLAGHCRGDETMRPGIETYARHDAVRISELLPQLPAAVAVADRPEAGASPQQDEDSALALVPVGVEVATINNEAAP